MHLSLAIKGSDANKGVYEENRLTKVHTGFIL